MRLTHDRTEAEDTYYWRRHCEDEPEAREDSMLIPELTLTIPTPEIESSAEFCYDPLCNEGPSQLVSPIDTYRRQSYESPTQMDIRRRKVPNKADCEVSFFASRSKGLDTGAGLLLVDNCKPAHSDDTPANGDLALSLNESAAAGVEKARSSTGRRNSRLSGLRRSLTLLGCGRKKSINQPTSTNAVAPGSEIPGSRVWKRFSGILIGRGTSREPASSDRRESSGYEERQFDASLTASARLLDASGQPELDATQHTACSSDRSDARLLADYSTDLPPEVEGHGFSSSSPQLGEDRQSSASGGELSTEKAVMRGTGNWYGKRASQMPASRVDGDSKPRRHSFGIRMNLCQHLQLRRQDDGEDETYMACRATAEERRGGAGRPSVLF